MWRHYLGEMMMRAERRLRTWLAIMAMAVLLTTQGGCVSSQKLTGEDRQAIHTIYLDSAVVMPNVPILVTRGQAFAVGLSAGLGGAIGGAIAGGAAAASGSSSGQTFLSYLTENNIHVDEMLVTSFSDEVQRSNLFPFVKSADEADAILKLEVTTYGLGYTANMFSHDYRATLAVSGTLTRTGGKVVWSKRVIEQAMRADWAAASMKDLFAQPELMRAQMAAASNAAAKELVANLGNDKP
jgi:hypothetical protein